MSSVTGRRRHNLINQLVSLLRVRERMTGAEISESLRLGRGLHSRVAKWLATGHLRVVEHKMVMRDRVYGLGPSAHLIEDVADPSGNPEALRMVLDALAVKNLDRDDIATLLGIDHAHAKAMLDVWMQADWICGSQREYTVGPRWLRDKVSRHLNGPLKATR